MLAIPPAAAVAAAVAVLAMGIFDLAAFLTIFTYAFAITSLGLLFFPLPVSYALERVGVMDRIAALTAFGALMGAYVLNLFTPPVQFFAPGFVCGGIGTFLWAALVAIAENPKQSRGEAAKGR